MQPSWPAQAAVTGSNPHPAARSSEASDGARVPEHPRDRALTLNPAVDVALETFQLRLGERLFTGNAVRTAGGKCHNCAGFLQAFGTSARLADKLPECAVHLGPVVSLFTSAGGQVFFRGRKILW